MQENSTFFAVHSYGAIGHGYYCPRGLNNRHWGEVAPGSWIWEVQRWRGGQPMQGGLEVIKRGVETSRHEAEVAVRLAAKLTVNWRAEQ